MTSKIDDPMEFFKEEMANDQIAVRVNAVHRSPIVAALIGEKDVEKELIPFFESKVR